MPAVLARATSPAVVVATLIGRANVEVGELCLGTLVGLSADRLRLRIHDDGSLREGDVERLRASVGDCDVVWRPEADERMDAELAAYPGLRRFRRESPLALKLLDTVAWTDDRCQYCDSDVLFLRPFAGLFGGPPDEAVFMRDRQNAYSVRSWHLIRHRRLRLRRRINSGIVAFPRQAHDLDLLEWFLGHPEFRFSPPWVEQTCWALLAARTPCRLVDGRQMVIPVSGSAPTSTCVGAHFVGPVRSEVWRWRQWVRSTGRAETIRSTPAGRCLAVNLAVDETRRVLARLRDARRPSRRSSSASTSSIDRGPGL